MLHRTLMLIASSLAAFVAEGQAVDPGQQTFSNICAACHGLDGQGGEHAPNISTNPEVQRMTDREISSIVRYGIPSKGMPSFQTSLQRDQIAAVIRYLRIMGAGARNAALPGNAEEGKTLFFGAAHCVDCHTLQGHGGFLGADLTAYGNGHSPDAIRKAILHRSENQDPHHSAVTVLTRDGKSLSGVIRNEDNFSIQLQTADGGFHSFDKRNLAKVEHEAESLMPQDYAKTLSPEQLDNLVKFLSQSASSEKASDEDE